MEKQRKSITASDLINLIDKNKSISSEIKAIDDTLIQKETQIRNAQSILIEELKAVGVTVSSIWDLVNTKESYNKAIPILLRHLTIEYPDVIKEGIARALTVPEARGMANAAIISEFALLDDYSYPRTKWALANALQIIALPDDIPAIERLIAQNTNGIGCNQLDKLLRRLRGKELQHTKSK